MNVYIGQNTKNERLYWPNTQKMERLYWPNTKNERLYRPKHKK